MLKYLFTAQFEDGSEILQDQADKSSIEPEKRSQFFDVLKMDETKKLVHFELSNGVQTYAVDLRNGLFEIDRVTIATHEETNLRNFKIIFLRQHTHVFKQGGASQGAEPKQLATREIGHDVAYIIGWEAVGLDGRSHKRIIKFT